MYQIIFSSNRIIDFEFRQAFAYCCELPPVWRKCFSCKFCNIIRCMGKCFYPWIMGEWLMVLPLVVDVKTTLDCLFTLGRCYCLFFGWCYCHVLWQMLLSNLRQMLLPPIVLWQMLCHVLWQMLLPFYVEDVKPHMFLTYCNKCDGWCYCLVADGIATGRVT